MAAWYNFVTVDVFTDTPYEGNPLAIVHIPKNSSVTQDQKFKIAKEFNLSETVFLHEDNESAEPRQFDIFTVLGEVPWAGHPTIGTICYISSMERGNKPQERYSLKAKAGTLEAYFNQHSSFAEAEIPVKFHVHLEGVASSKFLTSQPRLQQQLKNIPSSYPIASIVNGMNFVLVELPTLEDLSRVSRAVTSIDHGLDNLDQGWERGLLGAYFFVINMDNDGMTKVRARMIESDIGEDPATGSAAADLSCYLSTRQAEVKQVRLFEIEQGTEIGRRSIIKTRVEMDESGTIKRVALSGQAVLVQQGKILA